MQRPIVFAGKKQGNHTPPVALEIQCFQGFQRFQFVPSVPSDYNALT